MSHSHTQTASPPPFPQCSHGPLEMTPAHHQFLWQRRNLQMLPVSSAHIIHIVSIISPIIQAWGLILPTTLGSFCPVYTIRAIWSEGTTEHGTGCFSFREAHCPSKVSSCWFPVRLRGETGRFLLSCVVDDASCERLQGTFTAIRNTEVVNSCSVPGLHFTPT